VELTEGMLSVELVNAVMIGCGIMERLIVCWRSCLIGLVDLWWKNEG
jgi:hypothetical protein